MDIIQFLKTIYRHLPVLILLPVITVIITFIFVKNKEGDYRARAVISSGFIEAQNTPGNDGRISRDQITFRYANLMELISSKPVFDQVSYSLLRRDLQNTERAFRPRRELYRELNEPQKAAMIDTLSYYISNHLSMNETDGIGQQIYRILVDKEYDYESLRRRVRINRMGQSDYIQILVETENPDLSAYIANTLATRFISFYRQSQDRTLGVNIEFYLEQVRLREVQLQERTRRLQDFKVANSITNLYEQTKAIAVQMSDFEFLRQTEMRTFRGAQSLIDSMDVVLREGGVDFTEGRSSALNTQIAVARSSMAELNRRMLNARIRGDEELATQLLTQIDQERTILNESISRLNDQAIADPRVARQDLITRRLLLAIDKENARQSLIHIETELTRMQNLTREFARVEAILDSYIREIDLAERDYLSMLDRLNEFRLRQQSMSSGTQMETIERALPPRDPLPSKRLLILLVAAAGSFAFGLVAIFAIEYFDLTIRNAKQLADRTQKPVFGMVPLIGENDEDELNVPELFEKKPEKPLLAATLSLVRLLRSNVLTYMNGKRLLITSSQARSGKTFISIVLGYAIAQTGRKVLIVDTNTISNDLTLQFDVEPHLFEYLRGEMSLSMSVHETGHENVHVLGCEKSNLTISEVAVPAKIKDAFEKMSEEYDLIIIDSTTMVRDNNSRELLEYADSITLTYAAGEVVNGIDASIIEEIDSSKITFNGSILNKVAIEEIQYIYGDVEVESNMLKHAIKQISRGNIKGAFSRADRKKKPKFKKAKASDA
ncbi:MAG: AAA family ATPase [Balneolales bacterium]|nr:AAA family ATPase [Balneolales bacterium]